ncbi:MAG: hypothetical protein ABI601_02920 [bacterium]
MSYRIGWEATGEQVSSTDATKQFRFTGWHASTRLEAAVEVPSTGFS